MQGFETILPNVLAMGFFMWLFIRLDAQHDLGQRIFDTLRLKSSILRGLFIMFLIVLTTFVVTFVAIMLRAGIVAEGVARSAVMGMVFGTFLNALWGGYKKYL